MSSTSNLCDLCGSIIVFPFGVEHPLWEFDLLKMFYPCHVSRMRVAVCADCQSRPIAELSTLSWPSIEHCRCDGDCGGDVPVLRFCPSQYEEFMFDVIVRNEAES
jgi:hypothetical protein